MKRWGMVVTGAVVVVAGLSLALWISAHKKSILAGNNFGMAEEYAINRYNQQVKVAAQTNTRDDYFASCAYAGQVLDVYLRARDKKNYLIWWETEKECYWKKQWPVCRGELKNGVCVPKFTPTFEEMADKAEKSDLVQAERRIADAKRENRHNFEREQFFKYLKDNFGGLGQPPYPSAREIADQLIESQDEQDEEAKKGILNSMSIVDRYKLKTCKELRYKAISAMSFADMDHIKACKAAGLWSEN